MGQKVHPQGIRLGINKTWNAAWYAPKAKYASLVKEDLALRKYLGTKLASAGLESILIKRYSSKLEIEVSVARPGVVIGRGGSGIEAIKKQLATKYGNVELKVFEVKKPDVSAALIADNIVNQLQRRIVPKFICQRILDNIKSKNDVKGVRIWVSGRIKGAEIARREKFQWGTVPLQTLRADIDYAYLTADVPNAGKHGVKVWVYKGEKFTYDINE